MPVPASQIYLQCALVCVWGEGGIAPNECQPSAACLLRLNWSACSLTTVVQREITIYIFILAITLHSHLEVE